MKIGGAFKIRPPQVVLSLADSEVLRNPRLCNAAKNSKITTDTTVKSNQNLSFVDNFGQILAQQFCGRNKLIFGGKSHGFRRLNLLYGETYYRKYRAMDICKR
jgi:hypothetical protein